MKFAEFVQRCQQLLQDHPEAGELKVFNTSCFDSPQRAETSSVYIGSVTCEDPEGEYERFLVTDDPDVDLLDTESEFAVASITTECVVVEAF